MAREDLKYIIGFETNDAPVVAATKALKKLTDQQALLEREYRKGVISKNIFKKGQRELNNEIIKLRDATKQGGEALKRYITQMEASGKAARRKEVAIQQAGYQLQDFIVQVQAGTNPLIAFSQQGSQLAGFFAGPWGAAIGLGIAALSTMAMAFLSLREETKSLQDAFDDLGEAQKRAKELTEDLAASQIDMVSVYGDMADKVREYNLEIAKKAISDLEELFGATEKTVKKRARRLSRTLDDEILGSFGIEKLGERAAQVLGFGLGAKQLSPEQKQEFERLKVYLDYLAKAKGPRQQYEAIVILRDSVEKLGGDFEKVFGKEAAGDLAEYSKLLAEAENDLKALSAATMGMDTDTQNFLLKLKMGLLDVKDLLPPIVDGTDKAKQEVKSLAQAFRDAAKEAREVAKAVGKFYEKMQSEQSTVAGLEAQLAVLKGGGSIYEARAAGAGTSLREQLMKDPVTQEILRTGTAGEVATMLKNINDRVALVEKRETIKGKIASLTKGASTSTKSDQQKFDAYIASQQRELELKVKNFGLTEEIIRRNEYEFKIKEKAASLGVEATEKQIQAVMELYDKTAQLEQLQPYINAFEDGLTNAFVAVVDGTQSVENAFKSMLRNIILEIYRQEVASPAVKGIFGFVKGLFQADGGGYTGSGPRSGGLDGKGGFLAMLHPKETVIDHTKGQSAEGVTVVQNINISTGVQQTVRNEIRTLMPQIANSAKAAVSDAKRRGGSYGRALS